MVGLTVVFFYLLYLAVILTITRGWFRLKPVKITMMGLHVSVIISARNEAKNIIQCLSSIARQSYPKELFEVMVIDDASEDDTPGLISEFAIANPQLNLKLLKLKKHSGKKAALSLALAQASGEFALTTDADCTFGSDWISAMVDTFVEKDAVFVAGPVDFKSGSLFADLFPGLEYMSLIASGAGAIGAGFPIMCNGANMGFSIKHYNQLPENAFRNQVASGEDVFLMQAFKNRFGSSRITFARNSEAMVFTNPPENIKNFLSQRLRWTSKSIAYRDLSTIIAAISVLMINLIISILMIATIVNCNFWAPTLTMIGLKTITDLPLLAAYALFSGKSKRIAAIFPAEPLVALITTFTGFAGHFVNVNWKGIKIRNV